MNYIENIYICLAAPLLIAAVCLRGRRRRIIIYLLAGMTSCLASSYISTFLAMVHEAEPHIASIEIAPMVEELLKVFPVLFFLLVLEIHKDEVIGGMLIVAVGFATFENVCFLLSSGTESLPQILIRGFGTGAMHVVSGVIVAAGLYFLWDRHYLRFVGTAGLLSLAITYHAVFNLLVTQSGAAARVGYILPILTVILVRTFGRRIFEHLTQ